MNIKVLPIVVTALLTITFSEVCVASCATSVQVEVKGTGPGFVIDPTEPPSQQPPDFITTKVWLTTPWQTETYKYGSPEIMKMHAEFKNIGDGGCSGTRSDVEVHFYLSKGYKEDSHTQWTRVGIDAIPCSDFGAGVTPNPQEEGVELYRDIPTPGIWNIVACVDHPLNVSNNGGDHPEKHESNNCSTEAVFEVTADGARVNIPNIDFITHSFQFLQTPTYAGDQARFGGYVQNIGLHQSQSGIRSGYFVQCGGTPFTYLTDDGTDAVDLIPGKNNWEQNNTPVTMPNASGACTAYFCADYAQAVTEGDDNNNCSSFPFTLQPRPKTILSINKFQDQKGCCTTNTGEYIYPDIWVYNGGQATPGSTVRVLYQISSPIGTGGAWWTIGYGAITPGELAPGTLDEDYMDDGGGRWRIPSTSAWKNQWHTVRACIHPQGNEPTGGADNICATYARKSKT